MFSEENYLGFDGYNETTNMTTNKIREEIKKRCEVARTKSVANVLPFILMGGEQESFSEIIQFKNQRYVDESDHLDEYLHPLQ